MHDYCAFSKDHKCIKWEDYQIMLQEIEEADSLCHGNYRKSLMNMVSIILCCCNLIRGSGAITPAPQVCPSRMPLTSNPHE